MISNRSVDQVRRFERLYENYLRKVLKAVATEDFTVADTRVLHEMGFVEGGASGAWLAGRLDLDAGYLCRILKKLEAYGLVVSRDSDGDGRMKDWELTKQGRDMAAGVETEYRDRTRSGLIVLSPEEQRRLVAAMQVLERLLRPRTIVSRSRP